jgi:hypothetical protein
MPSLTDLTTPDEPRELKVEWQGPPIVVSYYPTLITGELAQASADAPETEQVRVLSHTLELILTGWDVTNDAGEPLETTAENLMALPLILLSRIMEKIGEDNRPDPTSGRSFGGGS